MRRILLLTTFCLTAIFSVAQTLDDGYELHADKTDSRIEDDRVVTSAHGNARFRSAELLLLADEILGYFYKGPEKKRTFVARGNVRLTQGTQRILADEITLHLPDRTFTAAGVRVGDWPLYLSAGTMSGNLNHIVANNATITYHEPSPFSPAFTAKRLVYDRPVRRIHAEDAHIGIGTTVPINFPSFEQRIDEPALSYLNAKAGYRSSLGAFLGVGAHVPVRPNLQLGGDVSYFSRRGVLAGPSAAYRDAAGKRHLKGEFRTGYIRDYGTRLTDVLDDPIGPDRAFVDWTHNQKVGDRLTLLGQFNYWSDSEVLRDFHGDRYYHVQVPDSFVEADYASDNYVVSLFARGQPNRYHLMQERLPEVRFDLLPMHVGGGLYERFHAGAARLSENHPLRGQPTYRTDRFDAYYGLERPWSPKEWLTVTPVAGGRVTHYERALGGRSHYTRTIGEVGLDATLLASGLYEYRNEQWKIDGIRHLVTPRLSYRYQPSAERGRAYIPPIDDLPFATYLQPLGLADQRHIDDLRETNTLRLSVDNTFQTRDRRYGSRDLLRLNLAADFRFERAANDDLLSDIHSEIEFMPAPWLRFDLYQRVSPEGLSVNELNTGLTVFDGRAWSARIANHFLKHQISEYITEGRYRLNEAYQVSARLHYDSRRRRFVEQSIGLHQNLENLWTIRYGISFYSGRARESDFGLNIEVRLAGF